MKKKLLFFIYVLIISLSSQAQTDLNTADAMRYLKAGRLLEAKNSIDKACNENANAKTWYYASRIYIEIGDKQPSLCLDWLQKAANSLEQCEKLDEEKKFDLTPMMRYVATAFYNEGVDKYNNNNYSSAVNDLGMAARWFEKCNMPENIALAYRINALCWMNLTEEASKEQKRNYAKNAVNRAEKSLKYNPNSDVNSVYKSIGKQMYDLANEFHIEGKNTKAIVCAKEALQCFNKVNDRENAARTSVLINKCENVKITAIEPHVAQRNNTNQPIQDNWVNRAMSELAKMNYQDAKSFIEKAENTGGSQINLGELFYFKSLIYGAIGSESPRTDRQWRKKAINSLAGFKEYNHSSNTATPLVSVYNTVGNDFYAEGKKFYKNGDYDLAIKKMDYATYYYNESGNQEGAAAAYWIKAMSYAKIGESLTNGKSSNYADYRLTWRGNAYKNITECRKNDDEGKLNTSFIYDAVGKGVYNKAKVFYDNDLYQAAKIYADSAEHIFVEGGNNDWADKAKNLARKSRSNIKNEEPFPEKNLSNAIDTNFFETTNVNNDAYVYVLTTSVSNWREYSEKHDGDSVFVVFNVKNDAKVFATYCNKTLGIPQNNIQQIPLESKKNLSECLKAIEKTSRKNNGNIKVILYYAGAALRDSVRKTNYLLPADATDTNVDKRYSLNEFYDELGKIPTIQTVCLIDAPRSTIKEIMYSISEKQKHNVLENQVSNLERSNTITIKGYGEDDDYDSGRLPKTSSIKIKPPEAHARQPKEIAQGNLIIITSTDMDEKEISESSFSLKTDHSLFNYLLLTKLQQSQGNLTVGELYEYIYFNTRRIHYEQKEEFIQNPTVLVSPDMMGKWRNIKL